MLILRGITIWLVIILAETLRGAARVLLLEPRVGDFRARQIGVLSGALMILAIAFAFARWLRAKSTSELLIIGTVWLILTVSFEIAFGRLVIGYCGSGFCPITIYRRAV